MERRITPAHIESLEVNDIYVYGTNDGDTIYSGTAQEARRLTDKYRRRIKAIIIKDISNLTLPLYEIQPQIDVILNFAKANPHVRIFVSSFGTGLDGYSVETMAALFTAAANLRNVFLPEEYWDVIAERPANKVFKPIATETILGSESVIDLEEWTEVTKAIIANLENVMDPELPTKIIYSYNGRIEAKVFYE
jgi:hypothetical protein